MKHIKRSWLLVGALIVAGIGHLLAQSTTPSPAAQPAPVSPSPTNQSTPPGPQFGVIVLDQGLPPGTTLVPNQINNIGTVLCTSQQGMYFWKNGILQLTQGPPSKSDNGDPITWSPRMNDSDTICGVQTMAKENMAPPTWPPTPTFFGELVTWSLSGVLSQPEAPSMTTVRPPSGVYAYCGNPPPPPPNPPGSPPNPLPPPPANIPSPQTIPWYPYSESITPGVGPFIDDAGNVYAMVTANFETSQPNSLFTLGAYLSAGGQITQSGYIGPFVINYPATLGYPPVAAMAYPNSYGWAFEPPQTSQGSMLNVVGVNANGFEILQGNNSYSSGNGATAASLGTGEQIISLNNINEMLCSNSSNPTGSQFVIANATGNDATIPLGNAIQGNWNNLHEILNSSQLWQPGAYHSDTNTWDPGTVNTLSNLVGATSGWSNVVGTSINDLGVIVGTATYQKQSPTDPLASGQHGVMLLPLQFTTMWETNNKANQIFNPTMKDDPVTDSQLPNTVNQLDGVPRNKLYMVVDPSDGKYRITLDVKVPSAMRAKFIAAAYVGDIKVPGSDTSFPAAGPVNLTFSHAATSNDIEDFSIRVGYDANGNGILDANEQCKLSVFTSSEVTQTGEAIVRGSDATAYNGAQNGVFGINAIIDGTLLNQPTNFLLPHAKRLLELFRDGNASSSDFPTDKKPTSSQSVSFNAFNGYFCEWLTHNSGAAFDDNGQSQIQEYTWDATTTFAQLVGSSFSITDPATKYYQATYQASANAYFASQPVGATAEYPSTGFVAVPHKEESPSWVTPTTVTFQNPPLPNTADDVNGSIGRGRLLSHSVHYHVEKISTPTYVGDDPLGEPIYQNVISLQVTADSTGEVQDLYDFNFETGGYTQAAQSAAMLQIGYGKGSYGSSRSQGIIFRDHILFNVSSVINP